MFVFVLLLVLCSWTPGIDGETREDTESQDYTCMVFASGECFHQSNRSYIFPKRSESMCEEMCTGTEISDTRCLGFQHSQEECAIFIGLRDASMSDSFQVRECNPDSDEKMRIFKCGIGHWSSNSGMGLRTTSE